MSKVTAKDWSVGRYSSGLEAKEPITGFRISFQSNSFNGLIKEIQRKEFAIRNCSFIFYKVGNCLGWEFPIFPL